MQTRQSNSNQITPNQTNQPKFEPIKVIDSDCPPSENAFQALINRSKEKYQHDLKNSTNDNASTELHEPVLKKRNSKHLTTESNELLEMYKLEYEKTLKKLKQTWIELNREEFLRFQAEKMLSVTENLQKKQNKDQAELANKYISSQRSAQTLFEGVSDLLKNDMVLPRDLKLYMKLTSLLSKAATVNNTLILSKDLDPKIQQKNSVETSNVTTAIINNFLQLTSSTTSDPLNQSINPVIDESDQARHYPIPSVASSAYTPLPASNSGQQLTSTIKRTVWDLWQTPQISSPEDLSILQPSQELKKTK